MKTINPAQLGELGRIRPQTIIKGTTPSPKISFNGGSNQYKKNQILLVTSSILATILAMPPNNLGLLGYISLVGLIKVSAECVSNKEAFIYGFAYGALTTLGINLWVLNLSIIGWLASIWVGLFPALFCVLIRDSKPKFYTPIWWSACWVSIEILRTSIIPFGWNPLSSLTSNIYLLQNCAWGSQYIVSFAICLSSGTLALCLFRTRTINKIISLTIAASIFALLFLFGLYRVSKTEKLVSSGENLELIPMTIMSSKEPFTPTLNGRWTILENHVRRTKEGNSPYLNIWPESIGFALFCHQPSWDLIKTLVQEIPGPLLLTPSYPDGDKIYNSSILLEDMGETAQLYKKRFLTPIGEYVPPFIPNSWTYSRRHPSPKDGDLTMLVTDNAGTRPYRIGVLICLEETLSIAAKQTLAQGAEIFISPSNHGDTGASCAYQQERMAQIRAIETCTPLVRIGNIGTSNVFDSIGREVFRSQTEKMHNIKVPLLKNKSPIFSERYLSAQQIVTAIFIILALIGFLSKTYNKRN